MPTATVYWATDFRGPNPPMLSEFGLRLLAEGDSWFSLSTWNPLQANNLLWQLRLSTSCAIVNCAMPSDTLQHMAAVASSDVFGLLLTHQLARPWAGILLSVGGNDLIAGAEVPPVDAHGAAVPQHLRLLRTHEEALAASAVPSGADYLSDDGWQTFRQYFLANMHDLVALRDAGENQGRPLMLHTYAVPVARPAGLTARSAWILPALERAGIPEPMQQDVVRALFGRFTALLMEIDTDSGSAISLPQVHVFNSSEQVALAPAQAGSTGSSGDWVNEIHLTGAGYRKFDALYGPWIEDILSRYPPW